MPARRQVAGCAGAAAREPPALQHRTPRAPPPPAHTQQIEYDVLVCAVGERPGTFGVPGVEEYCFFLKEVTDTVALRQRIQEVFELASLPGLSEDDMHAALHFVVVGGGPTGER